MDSSAPYQGLETHQNAPSEISNSNVLPFARFHLGQRPARDSLLPSLMSNHNVSVDVWSNFWNHIDQPIALVLRNETIASYISAATLIAALVLYLVIVVQIKRNEEEEESPDDASYLIAKVILFATVVAVFCIQTVIQNYFKRRNLESIRSIVAEASLGLESFGLVTEIHDEIPRDGRKSGYYLYFLPSIYRNDSDDKLLCVEIANDSVCGLQLSPAFATYHYVPNGMEQSVSVSDWSEFWVKIDTESHEYTSNQRRLYAILLLYIILIYVPTIFPDNSALLWVTFAVTWPLMFYGFYCLVRIASFDSNVDGIIREYAGKFKHQGLHIEYRKEQHDGGPSKFCSGSAVQRLIHIYCITYV